MQNKSLHEKEVGDAIPSLTLCELPYSFEKSRTTAYGRVTASPKKEGEQLEKRLYSKVGWRIRIKRTIISRMIAIHYLVPTSGSAWIVRADDILYPGIG